MTATVRRNPHQQPGCKHVSLLWLYHHEILLVVVAAFAWTQCKSDRTLALAWGAAAALWTLAKLLYH